MSTPAITLIAAIDRNRAIGRDGQMPWHLPDDLRHFKAQTVGKPVLMGRRTFAAIGRALPGRTNLVLTRDPQFSAPDVTGCNSLDAALALSGDAPELMLIGGGEIYALALPLATTLWLTEIDTAVMGADAWFPPWDPDAWREDWRDQRPADERHAFARTFRRLRRPDAAEHP